MRSFVIGEVSKYAVCVGVSRVNVMMMSLEPTAVTAANSSRSGDQTTLENRELWGVSFASHVTPSRDIKVSSEATPLSPTVTKRSRSATHLTASNPTTSFWGYSCNVQVVPSGDVATSPPKLALPTATAMKMLCLGDQVTICHCAEGRSDPDTQFTPSDDVIT